MLPYRAAAQHSASSWRVWFLSLRIGAAILKISVKLLRSYPHPEVEEELVSELVGSWCAFDGAGEGVWRSMGTDRKAVEGTKGSALEVSPTRVS